MLPAASRVLPVGLLWLSLYDVVNALTLPKRFTSTIPRLRRKDGAIGEVSTVSSLVDSVVPMTTIGSIPVAGRFTAPDPFPPLNIEAVPTNHDTQAWYTLHRALLHLTPRSSTDDPSTPDSGSAHSPGRAITGGVVGGLVLISLIAFVHFIWRRRKERRARERIYKLLGPRRVCSVARASVQTQAEPPIPFPTRARKSAGFTPMFEIRTPHGVMPSHPTSFASVGSQIVTSDVLPAEPIRALRHPTEVR